MALSGAPGRATVFEAVFQQLENHVSDQMLNEVPKSFKISRPEPLKTKYAIARAEQALNFEAFQQHLDQSSTPLIVPGTMNQWPARELWPNPTYLMRTTLGGRRLVPVEVGKSYTDDEWGQKIMSFADFAKDFLLPAEPTDIGYLAQHDLFAQIPALRKDITIPDYCYTAPPAADDEAMKTSGLASTPQLDEPLLNAWLGPKGTRTPLHTDPYHNILCQVVGYKYIRLYAPSQTPKLYPRGVDDKGINMENTSQVDVSNVRGRGSNGSVDVDACRELHLKYPLFGQAQYEECILGPGECLYIPLGWWHYVESLSTSFSVSFWWN